MKNCIEIGERHGARRGTSGQVDRRLAELTQSPEKLQATLLASPMIQELVKREPQVSHRIHAFP